MTVDDAHGLDESVYERTHAPGYGSDAMALAAGMIVLNGDDARPVRTKATTNDTLFRLVDTSMSNGNLLVRISAEGACRGTDVDRFVPDGPTKDRSETALALAICRTCDVRRDCLAWAIQHNERGVWGGTTQQHRDALVNDTARFRNQETFVDEVLPLTDDQHEEAALLSRQLAEAQQEIDRLKRARGPVIGDQDTLIATIDELTDTIREMQLAAAEREQQVARLLGAMKDLMP